MESGSSATVVLLSALVGALVGGGLSIVGGLIAARYQARRTEELTIRLRRLEREEQALIVLQREMTKVESALADLIEGEQAKPPPADAYGNEISRWPRVHQQMQELYDLWRRELSPFIRNPVVRDRYVLVRQRLKLASQLYNPSGSEGEWDHFLNSRVRDVLVNVTELRREIQAALS